MGPILGGIFSDSGAWEWIFLLKYLTPCLIHTSLGTNIHHSIPGAFISAVLILTALPNPVHQSNDLKKTLARVDYIGAILSIAGAILLIYALQTGGTTHPWTSAPILCTLIASLLSILLFFLHSHHLSHTPNAKTGPLFPLRLLRNRVLCLILL